MSDHHPRAGRQLALIGEVLEVARGLGVQVWLRGGWAMDFYLGDVTREHEDIDFFAWAADAEVLARHLLRHGFLAVAGPPQEQQRDFTRQGEDLSFALVDRDSSGVIVVVAGGPWAGEPYPEAVPHHLPGHLGDLTCPIVHPRGQIEMKRMVPEWNPRLRRRAKDAADIARLEAALATDGSRP